MVEERTNLDSLETEELLYGHFLLCPAQEAVSDMLIMHFARAVLLQSSTVY